jgi:beta-N-acetylhexosaminidase
MQDSMNAVGALGPILIGLAGTELDGASRDRLRHPAVGGVVLFTRNFTGREQLLRLVTDIRSLRNPRLLVCIDQEGGRVQRLRDGFTRLPPLRVLGRLHAEDPRKALDFAYRHGRVMATEMLACGIDLSFAPVLDLDGASRVIGDRAFSDRPEVVEELGRAYLGGMHDAGMKTTGKHFPGHGSVAADSHTDDVIDGRALEQIERCDLLPFKRLARQLDALMIAHVVYPAVDDLPAGYSGAWLRDILRERMGYRGVVLSDDLGMHAAKAVGDLAARTRLCLRAGCDLVLVCQPDDVRALLGRSPDNADAGLRESLGDAAPVIARLYGQPTIDAGELDRVAAEGIREWQHWQRSLEELGEHSWV